MVSKHSPQTADDLGVHSRAALVPTVSTRTVKPSDGTLLQFWFHLSNKSMEADLSRMSRPMVANLRADDSTLANPSSRELAYKSSEIAHKLTHTHIFPGRGLPEPQLPAVESLQV